MAKINEVTVTADQVYRRKVFAKLSKVIFLLLFAIISLVYFILYMIYNGGSFTIRLDRDLTNSNIFLTLDENGETVSRSLSSQAVEYMDNISIKWIKPNVDTESMGTHNGDNYYAYSFYLINNGDETINYWYEIDIEDTLLNLDEAIRVMVYRNGERTVYAKANSTTGNAEDGTKIFYSYGIPVLEEREKFAPGDKDRFTIVVWIEGDDPDCNNELIGGGIKMSMKMTEERIER